MYRQVGWKSSLSVDWTAKRIRTEPRSGGIPLAQGASPGWTHAVVLSPERGERFLEVCRASGAYGCAYPNPGLAPWARGMPPLRGSVRMRLALQSDYLDLRYATECLIAST